MPHYATRHPAGCDCKGCQYTSGVKVYRKPVGPPNAPGVKVLWAAGAAVVCWLIVGGLGWAAYSAWEWLCQI